MWNSEDDHLELQIKFTAQPAPKIWNNPFLESDTESRRHKSTARRNSTNAVWRVSQYEGVLVRYANVPSSGLYPSENIHSTFMKASRKKNMPHCNMASLCTQRRMRLTSHLVTSSPFISHVEQITPLLGRALLFSYYFCFFSCVFSACLPSSTAPVPCLRSSLVGTSSRRGHTSSPRCRCASNFSILFSSHSTYSVAHTATFRCHLSVLMFQFSAPLVLLTCLLLGAHLNCTTTSATHTTIKCPI